MNKWNLGRVASATKIMLHILFPACIALYLIYPLLTKDYSYPVAEYKLYKSFMVNFIEILRQWELPQWDEYIGSGHPALIFGHYPISLNTSFYMLFGFGDFTHYLTKLIGIVILLLSFICVRRYLKMNYLISLLGALVYFSVNFVIRIFPAETVGYLFFLYPLLMILTVKIVDENKTQDILVFSLVYIAWLAGGHIIYVYMHCIMLSLFYLVTIWVYHGIDMVKPANLKKFTRLYLILFILPWLGVLYQYYFIYDLVSASGRLKAGLIVSPFDLIAWKQLMISFESSSYFLVGLLLCLIYAFLARLSKKYDFIKSRELSLHLGGMLLIVLFFSVAIYSVEKTRTDGVNLVVNGEFEANADGWKLQGAHASIVHDVQRAALQIATGQDVPGYASIAIPTRIGRNYRFAFYFKKGTAAFGQIKIGDSESAVDPYYSKVLSDSSWKQYRGVFQAITPITYVTLASLAPLKGQSSLFDTVEIYEINSSLLATCKRILLPLMQDYIPLMTSEVFLVSLSLYLLVGSLLLYKKGGILKVTPLALFKTFSIAVVYISLLSYYFYSPENIMGDVNGYDYDLFRELSPTLQVVFTLAILYSIRDYRGNNLVKTVVLSAVVLYFIRSHLTIPLMRFTGIVWYATRDGSIFSFFFSILFMFGLKNMFNDLTSLLKFKGGAVVRGVQFVLLIVVLVFLIRDSHNKLYKGTSHRFVYPNTEKLAQASVEKWVFNGRKGGELLTDKIIELDKETKHFYRLFSPEASYLFITGSMQDKKIHDAAIYESSISRELQDFYRYTILGKAKDVSKELKDAMPYNIFTKHVHAGLGLSIKDITYRDFFIFYPAEDLAYIRNQNIEFMWDLMQVKYLVIGPELSKELEKFSDRENYKLLGYFSQLDYNLYEITKNKSYSRLAILPVEDQRDYSEAISQLNSKDVNVLKKMYSKLVFLDPNRVDLSRSKGSHAKRNYRVDSGQGGILIDFESWNRHWGLMVNGKDESLEKSFQIFKGIKLNPGMNDISLNYDLRYFKALFVLSVLIIMGYLALLGFVIRMKKDSAY